MWDAKRNQSCHVSFISNPSAPATFLLGLQTAERELCDSFPPAACRFNGYCTSRGLAARQNEAQVPSRRSRQAWDLTRFERLTAGFSSSSSSPPPRERLSTEAVFRVRPRLGSKPRRGFESIKLTTFKVIVSTLFSYYPTDVTCDSFAQHLQTNRLQQIQHKVKLLCVQTALVLESLECIYSNKM